MAATTNDGEDQLRRIPSQHRRRAEEDREEQRPVSRRGNRARRIEEDREEVVAGEIHGIRGGSSDLSTRSGSTGIVDLSPRSGEAIDLTGHVHHLPCCVKFTGATSVSHYFKPKTTDAEVDGLVVEEAFFRGRKLQGTTIDLPEGYSGFVMGKISFGQDKVRKAPSKGKSSAMLDGNMNSWEMLTKYRKITVWNHESFLSQDDAFLRSFHWFAVSKALHEPVTPEDLASVPIAGQSSH